MTSPPPTPSPGGHTRGPWVFMGTDPAQGWDGFSILAQPHPAMRGFTKTIADIPGPQADPVAEANARLIAASPDLLRAATFALGLLTGNMDGDWEIGGDPIAMLRAAIAKATGSPSPSPLGEDQGVSQGNFPSPSADTGAAT